MHVFSEPLTIQGKERVRLEIQFGNSHNHENIQKEDHTKGGKRNTVGIT